MPHDVPDNVLEPAKLFNKKGASRGISTALAAVQAWTCCRPPLGLPVLGTVDGLRVFDVVAVAASGSGDVEQDEQLQPCCAGCAMVGVIRIDGCPSSGFDECMDVVVKRLAEGVSVFAFYRRRELDVVVLDLQMQLIPDPNFGHNPQFRVISKNEAGDLFIDIHLGFFGCSDGSNHLVYPVDEKDVAIVPFSKPTPKPNKADAVDTPYPKVG